ncbi:MAG: alpha/beta hydrolase family protein [Phycisphaerae bacterium]
MTSSTRTWIVALAAVVISGSICLAQDKPAQPAANQPAIDWVGSWQGTLKIGPQELRLGFDVTRSDDGKFAATMDSYDQGALGMPVKGVEVAGESIKFDVAAVAGTYDGKWIAADGSIEGTWKQGQMSLSLNLKRGEKPQQKRPQEPKPPFPYDAEDVEFANPQAAGVKLSGTLTLPRGGKSLPVAILISGSGPQDRDEALMGHKPFLVLADHLTRAGMAVLRYDDRGIGKSTGNFATSTSEDFVGDALAAVAYLKTRKEVDPKKIGFIGHSEGGIVGPWAASQSRDVAFVVMIAGPGVRGEEILYEQAALIAKAGGATDEAIETQRSMQRKLFALAREELTDEEMTTRAEKSLAEELAKAPGGLTKEVLAQQIKQLNSPWFKLFLRHEPVPILKKVSVPVLVINGEKDLQVPPKQNLPVIEKALRDGGNKDVTIVELPELNHLLQTATTGSIGEYSQIEETMAPAALSVMSEWIAKRFGAASAKP